MACFFFLHFLSFSRQVESSIRAMNEPGTPCSLCTYRRTYRQKTMSKQNILESPHATKFSTTISPYTCQHRHTQSAHRTERLRLRVWFRARVHFTFCTNKIKCATDNWNESKKQIGLHCITWKNDEKRCPRHINSITYTSCKVQGCRCTLCLRPTSLHQPSTDVTRCRYK